MLAQKPSVFMIGSYNKKVLKVGVIGSRKPTAYGLRFTTELATELASRGIITVSGFARGIDSAAHKASLERQGQTIAILGCGIDIVYPPENKPLFSLIKKAGAIISEFKPGMPPLPQNFPRRNRLISIMSDLLIVVEAGDRSGTLITVDFSLEQGKEVMVLPGSIYSKQSIGTNRLIKQGAEPITSVDDVLEKLGMDRKTINNGVNNHPLLQYFCDKALSLDELSNLCNTGIDQLALEVSKLQIEGYLNEDLSGRFYRIR